MITRRGFLGLPAALLPLSSCGDGEPGAACSIVLDVETDVASVVVWSATATHAVLTVATPAGAIAGRWQVPLGPGGVGVVHARGLRPATAYVASLGLDDEQVLAPHRFVTAPAVDDPRPVRLAWSADIDPDPAYASPIFETLAAQAAEAYVSLGDWPYADNPPWPDSLDGFRERHAWARGAPVLQPWLHGTSVRAILDDHEVRNDWDAGTYAAEPERHAAALAAWDEWFPRRGGGPRYQRWRWGAHLECFLLDTRSHRSAQGDPDGPVKTMLGEVQRRWLVDGVTASAAPFKLVFTTVPLDFGHGTDHWAGYLTERDAILDALAAAATPGVIFLSADQHWFGAYRHRLGAREVQVGPLSRAPAPLPPMRPGILARSAEYNFGLLDAAAGELLVRVLGAAGDVLWDERFAPDDLTLRG
ncbi:MAG: alkaline phosphatase D family protein [Kofleriaceae bacterium]|nr:alkaline phosphatase D family protein [Kofleriaceae bacterium]MCL4226365.1 alkaline phosphatase D family protein [Myxococcales bacterium]